MFNFLTFIDFAEIKVRVLKEDYWLLDGSTDIDILIDTGYRLCLQQSKKIIGFLTVVLTSIFLSTPGIVCACSSSVFIKSSNMMYMEKAWIVKFDIFIYLYYQMI